jgi:hypothetical protein
MGILPLAVNDQVRLRKPHPCGSYDWHIVRIGTDIGLKCDGCGRKVMLPRSEAERRIKKILSHGSSVIVSTEQEEREDS